MREQELVDHVQADLCANVLECWRSFWNRQQEDITLFVCCLSIVRAVEGIHYCVFPVDASETSAGFSFSRVFVSDELLPTDDRSVQLDVLTVGIFWILDVVGLVNQKHNDRLRGHHMLNNISEVVGVTVVVKNV